MRPASHMPAEATMTIGPFMWLSRRESSQLPQYSTYFEPNRAGLCPSGAGQRRVGIGMIAMDLGQSRGQGAIDVDRDRPDFVNAKSS